MAIELNTLCLQCNLNRSLEKARQLGDEETAMEFARELLTFYAQAPKGASSPYLGVQANALLKKYYHLEDDRYRQEKIDSNRFVLERLPQIQPLVEGAADPVLAALQFSILGNYLDFAALQGKVSFQELEKMLLGALDMELDMDCYEAFCRELSTGKKLLYLTDNAGEVVFDRLLAEQIHKKYPQLEITFCVRGGPAHNDATREDAKVAGIPFPVIDNGNTVGGTELSLLSREAKEAMDAADVILAKGMGNAETLYGSGYPIFYAFLIKCAHFQDFFQKPMMTPMFIREKR